jgi:hypothetical protein
MNAIFRGAAANIAVTAALVLVPTAAHAQVRVTLQWLFPVESLFASDFVPQRADGQPDLLAVTLINGGDGAQALQLEFTIRMETPQAALVFEGTTDVFMLTGPQRRITNRDLTATGRDVSITSYMVSPEFEDLTRRIGRTGRLPAGTYLFSVIVRTPQGVELDRADVRVQVTNPTRVDLLTPGRPIGEPPPLLLNPTPRFLWSMDAQARGESSAAGLQQFRLRVVRADGATTPEEAMQGFPAWETFTSGTSALYPGSAVALRLEPGGTYAWQVTREVRTSTGTERVESPIYWFRIGGPGSRTTAAGADDAVAHRIMRLLEHLGLADELSGFRPIGPAIVDGRTVSLESLDELIAAIADGEIPLLNFRLR